MPFVSLWGFSRVSVMDGRAQFVAAVICAGGVACTAVSAYASVVPNFQRQLGFCLYAKKARLASGLITT